MRQFVLLAVALLAVGCTRPQAVLTTSQAALPLATSLAAGAPDLSARFAAQRRVFAVSQEIAAADIAADAATVSRVEREWKLAGSNEKRRRLAFLQERDAAILADPVPTPLVTAQSQPEIVSTKEINAVIVSLTGLAQQRKFNFDDIGSFVAALFAEKEKIESEVSKNVNSAAPQ